MPAPAESTRQHGEIVNRSGSRCSQGAASPADMEADQITRLLERWSEGHREALDPADPGRLFRAQADCQRVSGRRAPWREVTGDGTGARRLPATHRVP